MRALSKKQIYIQMSKIKNFAVVCMIALSLTSCTDKSKMLAKTWRVEDIKLSKPVPPQAQAFFQNMLQQMKDNLRLTYKADGSFEAAFGEKTSKGKWVLSKDAKQLTSTDDNGKTVNYIIVELSDKKFVYAAAEKGDTATFFLLPDDGKAPKAAPAQTMPNTPPTTKATPVDTAKK